MLNLGMSELLVFAIIAVIVLGPDKLPTAIRSVIKWYRQIKMLITNVQRDIERELEITEIRETMEKEIARFKDIEKKYAGAIVSNSARSKSTTSRTRKSNITRY